MIEEISDNCEEDVVPRILHLGCGTDYMEDSINIDTKITHHNAMLIPANSMVFEGEITSPQDFPKKHFNKIVANMVFEHVHPDKIPNLLYCLSNFLKDTGVIIATVPNFVYLAAMIVRLNGVPVWERKHIEEMREVNNEFMCPLFDSTGNHQSIWTQHTTEKWLNAEGFTLTDWNVTLNNWHVNFVAHKCGGDHVSPVE